MVLAGSGLRVELPVGWEGRFVRRSPHLVALQAGSFPLAADDEEQGPASVAAMAPGDCFLTLIEYLPGSGVVAGHVPFHELGLDLPLDPTRFASLGAGLANLQQSFTEAGRAFLLQVVLAGARPDRRHQIPLIDRILGSLEVAPGSAAPSGP